MDLVDRSKLHFPSFLSSRSLQLPQSQELFLAQQQCARFRFRHSPPQEPQYDPQDDESPRYDTSSNSTFQTS